MATTFKEHQRKLTSLQHKRAMYNEFVAVLEDEYLTYEDEGSGGDVPGRTIDVPDCAVPVVPEDTIELFAEELRETIQSLDKEIEEMQGRKVS